MKYQTFDQFEQAVKNCQQCRLSNDRINVVPGEGNERAKIMFIGEGPGKNEDEQGRPFVGTAGKFLTQLIEMIGLTRKEVYIANVVKCRPPGNRDPRPDEAKACWSWLETQIKLIKPKLIVPLGRHSLARFLPLAKISADHGRALRKNFQFSDKKKKSIVFFPCYHPSAALYNGSLRETIEQDFKKIPCVLEIIEKNKSKGKLAQYSFSVKNPEKKQSNKESCFENFD